MPVFGQEAEHGPMGKMSGTKMTDTEKMAKIDKMSTDDKAAVMKTSGQDVSKMSAQEKADMYDKRFYDA